MGLTAGHVSRCCPIGVVQHPTEPLAALDAPTGWRCRRQRQDQAIVEPLVIPFVVVVRDELAHGRPEARVAVMDEEPDVSQESVLGIGGVPHELGDPRPPAGSALMPAV